MKRHESPHEGVLLVDKTTGPTSHDVVSRVRKLLGTRRVGHAGTLDPMASGVLVVLVGEATKLAPYLTGHDKRYRAEVTLGRATDTLDADGATTLTGSVPPALAAELSELARAADARDGLSRAPLLAAALARELTRRAQVPPAYSAIHVDGQRSHQRARMGHAAPLPPRDVAVRTLLLLGVRQGESGPALDLEVEVSKGYYVRSLARDLGDALGVPAHLSKLRRVSSGPFDIDEAAAVDDPCLAARIVPSADAALRCLPPCRLTEEGARRASHGAALRSEDFAEPPPVADHLACIDPAGRLVAVARGQQGQAPAIERGFLRHERAGSGSENDTS